MIAVRDGWKGLTEGIFAPLGRREVSGKSSAGRDDLGTTVPIPTRSKAKWTRSWITFASNGSTLSSRSGVRTRSVSLRASIMNIAFPVIRVPKTIDHDL